MKFQGSNRGPLVCETNALPLHYFYAWAAQQKTCVYKRSMHFCQERVGWSGCGVEQKSGTLHLFNLSNFEFVGFQILMIWDLWSVNFHTVAVLALIFHLWFKLLSALCEKVLKRF